MHLLVLSAFRRTSRNLSKNRSSCLNAPSGAQCFPTLMSAFQSGSPLSVSMHLLVLSAFRPQRESPLRGGSQSLNAPSGAQCLPTTEDVAGVDVLAPGLNAPSGAQCFPTRGLECDEFSCFPVSMHLLMLSAFRLARWAATCGSSLSLNAPSGAQCFPTGDSQMDITTSILSQCTFWCSVLSDSAPRKPRHNAVYRNEIAADLESTTSNRPAPVQLNHTTAKNRHKTTQRRRRPLPASTPPASNEPKPKNRHLTTTQR